MGVPDAQENGNHVFAEETGKLFELQALPIK
jgi:hypothetical protein